MFPCIPLLPPPFPNHLIILVPSHIEMKTVLQQKLWQFNLMLKLKREKVARDDHYFSLN